MNKQQRQFYSSVLAVVFCGLFLLTGKLFIWPTPAAVVLPDSGNSSASATEPTAPIGTDSAVTTTSTTSISVSQSTTSTGSTGSTASGSSTQSETTASPTATEPTVTQNTVYIVEAPEGYFNDALFIGDSRTVGLANYAPIEGADYFATVGLASHQVAEAKNEVGEKKDLSFSELLTSKTYGKIYIMLGINELGNDLEKIVKHYRELIDLIRSVQPAAIICIEANLHVAHSRSDTDEIINNTRIDQFNAALSQFADNKTIFYLDINPLFDDGTGALGTEYTHDGTHPLAKYYLTWSAWLQSHAIIP